MDKNSQIILCNLKGIDKEGRHVLDYISTRFLTLCQNNATATRDKYSIIDIEKTVSVNIPYGTCLTSNYMAFRNPSYSTKWFFAFIDEVRYISDNCTEISFTVDAWHTWYDDFHPSLVMVEREHTNNDTIGANIEPEPLDIGDLIAHYSERDRSISTNDGYYVVFATTFDFANLGKFSGVTLQDGYLSSVKYYAFPLRHVGWEDDVAEINNFLTNTIDAGLIGGGTEAIQSVFLYPYGFFTSANIDIQNHYQLRDTNPYPIIQETRPALQERTLSRSLFRDYGAGLNIKNNKLYTYPYCFLRITNNNGAFADYRYEFFDGEPTVKVDGVFTVNGSYKIIPMRYRGQNRNVTESIPLGKFPVASFTGDSFREWLVGNAGNQVISNVQSGGFWQAAAGILTAGIDAYGNANTPTGNTSTADASFLSEDVSFKAIGYRPTNYKVKLIDEYFTKYGYATNRLKTPNITGRLNYNYVKVAQGEDICKDAIPLKYREKINAMFNRGVTIWHYYVVIGNYGVDNNIT